MQGNQDKEYYTTQEAARYVGVSTATLERLVKRKVLKKYRRQVDPHTYYKKTELDQAKAWRQADENG